MGAPTSSYATAGIALRVSGALRPHHHDKLETPLVGFFLVQKLNCQIREEKKNLKHHSNTSEAFRIYEEKFFLQYNDFHPAGFSKVQYTTFCFIQV
jgi:hypothetical protein